MKVLSLGVLLLLSLPSSNTPTVFTELTRKQQKIIGCTPDWSGFDIGSMAENMIPLPGAGNWNWKVSTKSDSAQFYFNQGMNLYYGFHIVEAVPSFRKAQQFDPECAMLYWGEALALGPNINDIGYAASSSAFAAAEKAAGMVQGTTAKEKLLINAMKVRYSNDSTANQSALNELYAAAMRGVYSQFDKDADVSTLLADALMLLHPWNFWQHDGKPQSWTPELVRLLEKTLKNAPQHPGANHYYIHVVEASDDPGRAMKSADRLGDIAPSLSHLVHMPSHIYVRTGRYENGIQVNTKALAGYEVYKRLYPEVEAKADLYDIHNRHMQAACAINLDDYQRALKISEECRTSFTPDWLTLPVFGYYIQYIYMTPEITMTAFRKWDDILRQPEVNDSLVYAKLLQSFAKGVAAARKGDSAEAISRLKTLEKLLGDTTLALPIGPMNAPKSGAMVAHSLLQGAIAECGGNKSAAITAYRKATELEDAMIYNEPKDWVLPARHWLGEALLSDSQWNEAAKVFQADLEKNPGNPYSQKGLNASKKKKQTIDM